MCQRTDASECMVSPRVAMHHGADSTAPGLTISRAMTCGVTTDKADEDNALKAYKDTIDCDGDPARIN